VFLQVYFSKNELNLDSVHSVLLILSKQCLGPWCSQLLSDLGAEVIKVEHLRGDDTRGWGPPYLKVRGNQSSDPNKENESVKQHNTTQHNTTQHNISSKIFVLFCFVFCFS
jgi:hypothetical protein